MIFNYFKTALRNFRRHKGFTLLNVVGLSLSMSVCLLIILVIMDHFSYDDFHKDKNRIYRIITQDNLSEFAFSRYASTTYLIGEEIEENYALTDDIVYMRNWFSGDAKYDDVVMPISGLYASSSFFSMFDFPYQSHLDSGIFEAPNQIALTKKVAKKYFGDEDPLGKIISINKKGEYTVVALIDNSQHKSHIKFECLVSWPTLDLSEPNWNSIYSDYVYMLVKEGVNTEQFQPIFDTSSERAYANDEENDFSFELQNLTRINPGPLLGNQISFALPAILLYSLAGLAFLVIASAAFNYTNLSVAKMLTRTKEIGVRKVSGATQKQVIGQFLIESVLIALISLLVSYLLLQFIEPAFKNLKIMSELNIDPQENIKVYMAFLLFALLTGLFAGFLPSLMVSRVNPVSIFNNATNVKLFSRVGLRKVLIVTQFVISIIFVISVTLGYRQVRFFLNADHGFTQENILTIQLKGNEHERIENWLNQVPEISKISYVNHLPGMGSRSGLETWIDNKDEKFNMTYLAVNQEFIQLMGLSLIAGENFPNNLNEDKQQVIIINEKAVQSYGYEFPADAIGQRVYINDSSTVEIIGVVKDFNFMSMFEKIKPMSLSYKPASYSYVLCSLSSSDMLSFIDGLEKDWKKIDDVHPFEARFLDEQIREFYMLFGDVMYIVGFVSVLALVIACLGFIGITTYNVETRIKEIGVRKVLGAHSAKVTYLISKSFMKLILIAISIGGPISYFINNAWLQTFGYRVSFGVEHILFGSFMVFLIALITISAQTLKAANTNPAYSLRYE